ncbi:hypothetical protein OAU96_02480 [Planctomycetota bacterium]|nr:hypothetical protein [Planctomycetota bacterium]
MTGFVHDPVAVLPCLEIIVGVMQPQIHSVFSCHSAWHIGIDPLA